MQKLFWTKNSLIIIAIIIITTANYSFAQAQAGATWPLTSTSTQSAIKSGLIEALEEKLQGTELNGYTGPNNSQRVRLAGTGNTWPANLTAKIDTAYVEFSVKPKEGVTFTIDSVALGIGASSTNYMKAEIYYSTDPDFKNPTQVNFSTGLSGNFLDRNNLTLVADSPNITITDTETFYLRLYPWHESSSTASGKYMCIQDVRISGTTTGDATIFLPTISTVSVSYISTTTAVSGGYISNDGGGAVTQRGVCWNTTGSPTTSDFITTDSTGAGTYKSFLTNLIPNKKYYLRSYAINITGTSYGEEKNFTTLSSLTVPTVTTSNASSILVTTASSGGNVTDWGGTEVTVKGVCWNTSGNPTIADSKTEDGEDVGSFSSAITNLAKTTKYYVRAYATNSTGTGYGQEIQFTTLAPQPDVKKVVAKDGSGDYTTVQAALNDVPDSYTGHWKIFIKKGTYYEKMILGSNKINVIIQGEDRDSTILVYDDYVGKPGIGNSDVSSFWIQASDFTAYNITFQNTSHDLGQALAVRTENDHVFFYNCRLLGYQDTYYGNGRGRVYFKKCYVEGTVDFIYGRSIMLFENCDIKELRNSGYLTAASTENTKFGIVFLNSRILADSIGYDGNPITGFYLGRPWHETPKVVFINCYEDEAVLPIGWKDWNVQPYLYAEYNCFGPGYQPDKRGNGGTQLTAEDAKAYTVQNILSKSAGYGVADWMPDTTLITSVERQSSINSIPTNYTLFQNYPNPFNPETIINYQIPVSGNVTLKIYDVLGREVITLVNKFQQAGNYKITFSAVNYSLTSGIYFYRIQSKNFVATKKMLLLK